MNTYSLYHSKNITWKWREINFSLLTVLQVIRFIELEFRFPLWAGKRPHCFTPAMEVTRHHHNLEMRCFHRCYSAFVTKMVLAIPRLTEQLLPFEFSVLLFPEELFPTHHFGECLLGKMCELFSEICFSEVSPGTKEQKEKLILFLLLLFFFFILGVKIHPHAFLKQKNTWGNKANRKKEHVWKTVMIAILRQLKLIFLFNVLKMSKQ